MSSAVVQAVSNNTCRTATAAAGAHASSTQLQGKAAKVLLTLWQRLPRPRLLRLLGQGCC